MAIYHLSVKPVSRAGGRSATAASAYRAAERVEDHTTGQVFDYTRKRGVEHTEIVLPTEAAKRDINWPRDRTALWNTAEQAERRKDARVAREYEVALPHELTKAQRLDLTREFSQEIANRFGCAVDFAIHKPHREGDQRNFHAHILTTTRQIEPTGLGAKTDIELADADRAKKGLGAAKHEVTAIRERWATLTNETLQTLGHSARVDHRTLEAQGIERAPTVHLGPTLTAMHRRGLQTEVGDRLQSEASERLLQARELGQLERERQDLARSIIDVSGDLRAALAARDLAQGAGRAASPEAVRQKAREQWLAMQKGAAKEPTADQEKTDTPARDKSRGRDGPDDDLSM